MRLLVFSDAHGDEAAITRILEHNESAQMKISLGDLECDESLLFKHEVIAITGNSHHDPGFVDRDQMEIEGNRIFMTHGHQFKVHKNLKNLLNHCKSRAIDVALYGHTHIAYHKTIFGILFLNPGSVSRPRNTLPPTYLTIDIDDLGGLTYQFHDAHTHEVIDFEVS